MLQLTSMPDLFSTLPPKEKEAALAKMKGYTSLWCCSVPPTKKGAGHIFYDMFWDVPRTCRQSDAARGGQRRPPPLGCRSAALQASRPLLRPLLAPPPCHQQRGAFAAQVVPHKDKLNRVWTLPWTPVFGP